jgi:hypothetical protein
MICPGTQYLERFIDIGFLASEGRIFFQISCKTCIV